MPFGSRPLGGVCVPDLADVIVAGADGVGGPSLPLPVHSRRLVLLRPTIPKLSGSKGEIAQRSAVYLEMFSQI